MQPLVRIQNVSRRFGDTLALDDVSLDIGAGEFFALLGPSGCGKTTLMRLIAGFDAPQSGSIFIDGVDMTGVPPERRPVNMMFQSYALFPHMSVARNIAFGLRQAGMGKSAMAARVEELLHLVQLDGLGARSPDHLSGGQKQRVALARALARRPRLLLLDEPLAALDRKLREETQFELTRLQRELGLAFLVVTHDQDEAMAMAHRIAVMRAGRIEQIGGARDIYEEPATRFVAGFIGEINLFEAHVTHRASGAMAICESPAFALPLHEALAEEGAIALAVRPERIRFGNDGAVNIAGEIADRVFLGDRIVWRVRIDETRFVRIATANAGMRNNMPARGARVTLTFDAADARVLTQ